MWAAACGLRGPRAGVGALLGGCDAGRSLLGRSRGLHRSPVFCGSKNLLRKFASKTRKKFWYESPSLGSHLTYKPSKLEFLLKNTPKKTRKEDHLRLRVLNGLLHKALADLLCTSQVSQEVYDLNVELSKVCLTSDLSACRVYWKTTLSPEQNQHTEAVLQRSAASLRHLVMAQQTLRNMPPIVFVRDKENAAVAEIDRLLAIADFGPPDEKEDFIENDFREPPALDTEPPSLSGIDHEVLNRQILEYRRKKEKGLAAESSWLGLRQPRRKARPPRGDSSLRDFLRGLEGDAGPEDDRAPPS